MPGLKIFTGNKLEILAEQLAQMVKTPVSSALAAEIIVVQSTGMERWVSLELDGTPIEGVGVQPDVRIEHKAGEGDITFTTALELLRKQTENADNQ